MGKEVHIYAPAYIEEEFDEILKYCDHIVFNSFDQWKKFKDKVKNIKTKKLNVVFVLILNILKLKQIFIILVYQNSRLGVTLANFKPEDLEGIDGLHFHTMCEQNSDTLERTLKVVDEKFGKYIKKMKWINFGGGHHITRADYDIETLIKCIKYIKENYDVEFI